MLSSHLFHCLPCLPPFTVSLHAEILCILLSRWTFHQCSMIVSVGGETCFGLGGETGDSCTLTLDRIILHVWGRRETKLPSCPSSELNLTGAASLWSAEKKLIRKRKESIPRNQPRWFRCFLWTLVPCTRWMSAFSNRKFPSLPLFTLTAGWCNCVCYLFVRYSLLFL